MKVTVLVALLLLIYPGCLWGQAVEDPASPINVSIDAIAGVNANPGLWHASAGLSTHATWRGWGLLGVATLGSGGEYESQLVTFAATRRVFQLGRLSLAGFGGYGYYREAAASGATRAAPGVAYGGLVDWRRGRLALRLMVADLTGDHDGRTAGGIQVTEPFKFHVLRYSAGIGVSLHD